MINIPRWLATFQASRDAGAHWYYQCYYAKSYFTTQVERLMSAVYDAVNSHSLSSKVMPEGDEPTEHACALTPTVPEGPRIGTIQDSPKSSVHGNQDLNVEPWAIDHPRKFVPSHVDCKSLPEQLSVTPDFSQIRSPASFLSVRRGKAIRCSNILVVYYLYRIRRSLRIGFALW